MPSPFDTSENIFEAAAKRETASAASPMPAGLPQQPPVQQVASRAVPGMTAPQGGPMPENPTHQQQPQGGSPLDKYAQLANIAPVADPKTQEPEADIFSAMDALTYGDVHKSYQAQSMTGNIDKKELSRVMQENDIDGLMGILNTVAQNAAAAATIGSTRITSHGSKAALEQLRKEIPSHLKNTQIAQLWTGDAESVLSSPQVAPLRDAAVNMFQQKFPQASAQQIQVMTEGYFRDFFAAGAASNKSKEETEKPAETRPSMSSFFRDL